jgi:hypothetical protein
MHSIQLSNMSSVEWTSKYDYVKKRLQSIRINSSQFSADEVRDFLYDTSLSHHSSQHKYINTDKNFERKYFAFGKPVKNYGRIAFKI